MIQNVGQREQQEREERKKNLSFFQSIMSLSFFVTVSLPFFARFIATFVLFVSFFFLFSLAL